MSNEQWSEWIEWSGGERPIGDGTKYQVKFRLGNVCGIEDRPELLDWMHNNAGGDIIAYRYKIKEPEVTEAEEEAWQAVESKQADPVNHPDHYQSDSGIECIDAIRAQLTADQFAAYCQGNITKYLWRWRNKGGIESVKKAEWYLRRMIEALEQ